MNSNLRVRKSLLIVFFLHEIFIIINSFFFNLKGADVDATRFQEKALIVLKNNDFSFQVDAEFYIQFLAVIFKIFGNSEFIASQFTIAAFFLFLFYVEKISYEVFYYRIKNWQIFLISLYPTVIPKVTTTMREAFMMMSIAALCFFIVKFKTTFKQKYFFGFFIFLFFGFLFHKAFAVMALFVLPFFLFYGNPILNPFKSKFHIIRSLMILILSGIILSNINNLLNVDGLKPLISAVSQDTEYMERIIEAKSSTDARATYQSPLSFSSPFEFIISLIPTITYYFFKPFFWEITSLVDFVAFVESSIRFFSVLIIIIYYRRIVKYHPSIKYLIPIILTISIIWAAGTTNYGTGSRHHLTTNWFFILIIGMYFYSKNFVIKK